MRTLFIFMRFSRAAPLKLIAGATAAMSIVGVAQAATVYDTSLVDPPGFYAGSGNPNSGFTVNTVNGAEFGLGVHNRYGADVPPTPSSGSVYHVSTGYYPATTLAIWNFDFSINLQASSPNAALHLADITPLLTIKNVGNGDVLAFNPLLIYDNSGWDGSSENVAYDPTHVPLPIDNRSTDYGFQNSENLGFAGFQVPLAFDPLADDTYIITLSAVLASTGADLGSVTETIVAGGGAAPLPAALPLFASGLGVFGFVAHRRKRKKAAAA
jgi:hypothetical protein